MVVDCGSTRIETCPECMEAIKTVRLVKNELGLKTSLSVERITAGLSHRGKDSVVNTFLAMALAAGLDIPVLDSLPAYLVETVNAFRALTGQSG
jgi:5-methyltetrahydrofolate--homocysteine methyltransferase